MKRASMLASLDATADKSENHQSHNDDRGLYLLHSTACMDTAILVAAVEAPTASAVKASSLHMTTKQRELAFTPV